MSFFLSYDESVDFVVRDDLSWDFSYEIELPKGFSRHDVHLEVMYSDFFWRPQHLVDVVIDSVFSRPRIAHIRFKFRQDFADWLKLNGQKQELTLRALDPKSPHILTPLLTFEREIDACAALLRWS